MKDKIRTILLERNTFVSGQELSDLLGVSRTAVWKAIRQLEEKGYEIEAVRNKGYRLVTEPDLLSEEMIRRYQNTEWAGGKILSLETVDSTNNEAKRRAEAGALHGLLVVSEIQTAGRGRMGRPWSSPKGSGIWMSLLLRPQLLPIQASGLTLVMALAVQETIEAMTGAGCQIKWPNDIVCGGKKLCGILTEMSAEPERINHIVIGVGINVSDEAFPEEIADTAISILQATDQKVCRAELIAGIMSRFEESYGMYEKTGNLSAIQDRYNACLVNCGRTVRVLDPAGEYEAVAAGINETGGLIVEKDGKKEEIISGEVSVRGIYGYV